MSPKQTKQPLAPRHLSYCLADEAAQLPRSFGADVPSRSPERFGRRQCPTSKPQPHLAMSNFPWQPLARFFDGGDLFEQQRDRFRARIIVP